MPAVTFLYSYMFGPQRERPCPMCTSLLSAWDGEAADVGQRVSLVVTARSPIERLASFAAERGWRHLRLYSDTAGDFTRDYVSAEDGDVPAFNVFTRRDSTIRERPQCQDGTEALTAGTLWDHP